MTQNRYQPGDPAKVEAHAEDDRFVLVFVRELGHPPERVWSALTDPAELREWAPFDADRSLARMGATTLTMAGPSPERLPAVVKRAEPPTLLEYSWGEDVLRWELEAIASGTRLTLRHTTADRSMIPKVAAGWHICLDVLDQLLKGQPIGRIVADDAMNHGWERLHDAYARQLGIPS